MKLLATPILFLVLTTTASTIAATPTDTATWMKAVKDDVLVKDMLLPGTHDSCAIRVNNFAQTQWSDVKKQLQRGIRYLDMRVGGCQGAPDHLCMYHGDIYLDMNFEEPKDEIYEFLRNNPSEAIFMRLKHEHDGKKADIKDFQGYVEKNYLTGHHEWFLHDNLAVDDLRMKDVRGHVVIFWDDGDKTSKWGYDYKSVNTREDWKFKTIDTMFNTFKDRADKATSVTGWYENPTSGIIGAIPNPKRDADKMNPRVQGYLNANPKTKGIISMDVPHDDMIKKLLELNAPFYA